jgi:hypothetical protein
VLRLGLLEVVEEEGFNHLDKVPDKVQGVVEQSEDLDLSDLSLDLHQSMEEIKVEDLTREFVSSAVGLADEIDSFLGSHLLHLDMDNKDRDVEGLREDHKALR